MAALWLYPKDYRAFTGTIPCRRKRPRSGRPRVTTATDDRYIVLQHLRSRRLTAAATGRQDGIQLQTVRNRLRQNVQPIRAYRPYFCQILTDFIEWQGGIGADITCTVHFRHVDWDLTLFSNECQYNLINADGSERVFHRRGEGFADAYVIELDLLGSSSVLVWGGIMGGNKTRLIVIKVRPV